MFGVGLRRQDVFYGHKFDAARRHGATVHQGIENKPILIDGPLQPVLLPWMAMTTSSRCHLSPSLPVDRLLISLAKCLANFSAQSLTVW